MIREKFDAVKLFAPIYNAFKDDKEHAESLTNGVVFLNRHAYLANDVCCGRVAVYDNINSCKVSWDYEAEISAEVSDKDHSLILSYPFTKQGGRVFFVRKRDIEAVIPNLTPLKKRKSIIRFSVSDDKVIMRVYKQKMMLGQNSCEKFFLKNKTLSENEIFSGEFELNLFYFEKIALDFFSQYAIMGLRVLDNGCVNLFIRRAGYKIDWMIRRR